MTTSFVGRRMPVATLRVRREPLRLPLLLLLLWWLLKLAVRLLLRVASSPVAVTILTALTLTWAVCRLANPLLAVAGILVLAGALVAIRFQWPSFFERWIWLPLRSRWRGWSIYRYKWPATMDFAELNRYRSDGTQYEPVLLTVNRLLMLIGCGLGCWPGRWSRTGARSPTGSAKPSAHRTAGSTQYRADPTKSKPGF